MKPVLRFGAGVALAVAIVSIAHADGDTARGRELAIRLCARCHVIGDYNRFGGLGSTPSFDWMTELPDYKVRIRTFYARRPHLAFAHASRNPHPKEQVGYADELTVTSSQIEDILSYIETLEPPIPTARQDETPSAGTDEKSMKATERMRDYIKTLTGDSSPE